MLSPGIHGVVLIIVFCGDVEVASPWPLFGFRTGRTLCGAQINLSPTERSSIFLSPAYWFFHEQAPCCMCEVFSCTAHGGCSLQRAQTHTFACNCTRADTNKHTHTHTHRHTHTRAGEQAHRLTRTHMHFHLFISVDTHRHFCVWNARIGIFSGFRSHTHTHTNTQTHTHTHTHLLLVKADTNWTMSSLGPSVSLSLLHTLINTDWPVVEACHPSIVPPRPPSLPPYIIHPSHSSLPSIHPPCCPFCPCIPRPLTRHLTLQPSVHPCYCFGPIGICFIQRELRKCIKECMCVLERERIRERGSIIVIYNMAGQGRVIWI